jgi:TonB family protein
METAVAAGVITGLVICINLILFSLFPLIHRLVSDKITGIDTGKKPKSVVMEYRKPEEKKEKTRRKVIRKVDNPSRPSGTSRLKFKFTPDLSVEGTGTVTMEQQELTAVIFEEGETDEPAVPLFQPSIPYPDRARDLEIEGILEVILIIDTQGKVASVEVVRSPHVSISNAARKVIGSWRFKPARNKGVPVKMRVRQVVEFTLE